MNDIKFPAHNGGLHITCNEHKASYRSVEEYIDDREINDSSFTSLEDRAKCIETDTLWSIQWYPSTPIGFYVIYGSSFDIVLHASLDPACQA